MNPDMQPETAGSQHGNIHMILISNAQYWVEHQSMVTQAAAIALLFEKEWLLTTQVTTWNISTIKPSFKTKYEEHIPNPSV